MDKRKIQYGIVVLMLAFVFVGCGQKKKNDVKVYENTEEVTADHEEASMTAIITSMDMEIIRCICIGAGWYRYNIAVSWRCARDRYDGRGYRH